VNGNESPTMMPVAKNTEHSEKTGSVLNESWLRAIYLVNLCFTRVVDVIAPDSEVAKKIKLHSSGQKTPQA
jgi:hypothetical protein